jgi:hypothetical protein
MRSQDRDASFLLLKLFARKKWNILGINRRMNKWKIHGLHVREINSACVPQFAWEISTYTRCPKAKKSPFFSKKCDTWLWQVLDKVKLHTVYKLSLQSNLLFLYKEIARIKNNIVIALWTGLVSYMVRGSGY